MGSLSPRNKYVWKTYQILGDFNPPTLNTLHSVVSTNAGMRVLSAVVIQTNTPTDSEQVDVVIEQDGNTWIYDSSAIGNMLHNTEFGVKAAPHNAVGVPVYSLDLQNINANGAAPLIIADGQTPGFSLSALEGVIVDVQVRQTSPIEGGARIRCKVTYQLLELA